MSIFPWLAPPLMVKFEPLTMKNSFLGKLMERVEHLEPDELKGYLLRMARENGLLETVFNTLREAVVVLDTNGRIEYCNHAVHKLLPIPADAPTGAPISKYLRDLDWQPLLMKGQATNKTLELRYPEPRVLELHLLPVAGGANDEFVAIFHDITQKHADTREVIESERLHALTLLAAGVAHELGNPINSINIHLQLMARDARRAEPRLREKLQESIRVARAEMERLDAIINRFLKAIRPTVPEFHDASLGVVIKETLAILQTELDDRNILVETDLPDHLPPLRLDVEQIKQAFYNLVKNAMQAMDSKGLLTIHAADRGDCVELSFEDNGPGISLENLPRVLEPYYTTKKRGTGLGLMIVQRILREHGAELQLESRHGQGTIVRIRFPLGNKQMRLLENK
ncbi:MAG: PAS domain-containing protein [Verrucomicrobiales bacterium]|jgi:signal transduction histidine kinase|nr:PAS domain-containing protein [Verrucomicrobiales bacterium]